MINQPIGIYGGYKFVSVLQCVGLVSRWPAGQEIIYGIGP